MNKYCDFLKILSGKICGYKEKEGTAVILKYIDVPQNVNLTDEELVCLIYNIPGNSLMHRSVDDISKIKNVYEDFIVIEMETFSKAIKIENVSIETHHYSLDILKKTLNENMPREIKISF